MSILIRNTANIRNLYNSLKKISLAVYATKLPQYNPVDLGSITSYRRYSIRSSILPSPPRSLPRSVQYLSTQTSRVENTRKIPFPLADIGEGITEVEVLKWFVKEGQQVKQFDKICEVQSDKATVEITSRFDGIVRDIQYKQGDIAKVGKPLCFIESIGEDTAANTDAEVAAMSTQADRKEEHEEISPVSREHEKVLTTPAVRRIAREHKIDLTKVKGSGNHGRVLKEDILAYIEAQQSPLEEQVKPSVSLDSNIEPIRGLRRAMTKTMTASLAVPQLTLGEEVVMDRLIHIRNGLKSTAEKLGVRLTYMPFFIKATSYCLSHFPILNSSVDQSCENIIYHRHHNISIAMDTPMGLTVPNIKHVEEKSVLEVAKDLQVLMDMAESGRLGEEQLKDGTFSLSNVGVISGTYTAPVVFVPQVAIGAFGRTRRVPVVNAHGHVETAHIINVSWSADHRIIDGATIARFSKMWKSCVEEPEQLLLHLK